MIKNFAILFTALLFASCNSEQYNINGTIDGESIDGDTIYLSTNNGNKHLDTTVVKDGKFTFSGKFESPATLRISDINHKYYANLLAENLDIAVVLAEGNASTVTSNGLNNELNKLTADLKSLDKSGRISLLKSTLKANKENSLALRCFWDLMTREDISVAEADSLLNDAPVIKTDDFIIDVVYTPRKAEEQTTIGSNYVDFACENSDGTTLKISDYIGKEKYVLLDFWATWCAPCVAAVPTLIEINKEYTDLTILGINVWDKKSNYLSYVNEKDLKWPMLYVEGNGLTNPATGKYGITGIPTFILIDPQGVIVIRTHYINEVNQKLVEIYE